MRLSTKSIAATALAATLATSTILPNYAFAQANQGVVSNVATEDIVLAPVNMQKVLNEIAASKVIMDSYKTAISTQGTIQSDILPDLPTYQQIARDHASDYTNNLNELLIDRDLDVVDFADEFTVYYDLLIEALDSIEAGDEQARNDFKDLLDLLQSDIQYYRDDANDTMFSYQVYKDDLQEDHFNFQNAATTALNTIELEDEKSKLVLEQLHDLGVEISNENTILTGEYIEAGVVGLELTTYLLEMAVEFELTPTPIGIALATFTIIYGAVNGNKELQEKQEKVKELTEQYNDIVLGLKGIQSQAAILAGIQLQLSNFYNANDGIIQSTRSLYKEWDSAYVGIQNLKDKFEQGEISIEEIRNILLNAKQSWQNNGAQASYINNQLHLKNSVENATTGS
ncbi:HBL/NHE enterotoxin family protein [Cytobacillus sp. Hm23]